MSEVDSLDGIGSDDIEEGVAELSRDELLSLNPFSLQNFSRQKIRFMAAFDTEKWYSELKGVTFATESAPVTWEEALSIQHFYQEGCCHQKSKVTMEDELHLRQLKDKIGRLFDQLRPCCSEQAFFVRMGPRSPKDAPAQVSEPWGISKERIQVALQESIKVCPPKKQSACELLHFFQTVCYSLLRVTTAEEAIALLASSARVMGDISHTMDHGKEGWDMNVVVRAWDSRVKLEREFRSFVVGGRIAAISQYDDQLCYEFAATHPQEILEAIVHCLDRARLGLQRLRLAAPTSAVVIDFAVVEDTANGTFDACVIELNPFGPMTGASLFTWTYDRRLLQGGQDLFGDLADWETQYSPGSCAFPEWVQEEEVCGVPYRYISQQPPAYSMDHLEAYWPDYLRLAPKELHS